MQKPFIIAGVAGLTFVGLLSLVVPEVLASGIVVLVLGVLTLPFGLSFYASTQLYETTEGIHDALKRAQVFAVSGRHDSA